MLTTSLEKIDKFYLGLTIILILMSVLLVFTFRGVFSMFLNASEFDRNSVGLGVTVKSGRLDEAYNFVFKKDIVHLQQIPVAPIETIKTINKEWIYH